MKINNQYDVPLIWEAALSFIDEELNRVMWNKNQASYDSPFSNSGNEFKCEVFQVSTYDWEWDLVDEDITMSWNFIWKDVKICWYKYFGRGMYSNQELSAELAADMLEEVIAFLRKEDEKLLKNI